MYRSSIKLKEEAIANINGEDLNFKHLFIDAEDDGSLALWMTDKNGHELNVRITIPEDSVEDFFDELTELYPYATGDIKGKQLLATEYEVGKEYEINGTRCICKAEEDASSLDCSNCCFENADWDDVCQHIKCAATCRSDHRAIYFETVE